MLSLPVHPVVAWHLSAVLLYCGLVLKYLSTAFSYEAAAAINLTGLFGCGCPISFQMLPPLLKMFPVGSLPAFAFGVLA